MARILKTTEIEGQEAVALFDTGAIYTYVRAPLMRDVPKKAMIPPARVGLGGGKLIFRNYASFRERSRDLIFLRMLWCTHYGAVGNKARPANRQAGFGGAQAARIHRVLNILNEMSTEMQPEFRNSKSTIRNSLCAVQP